MKGKENYTTEVSLDEADKLIDLRDLSFLVEELEMKKVHIDEVAPKFPGFFEKGVDYYWKNDNGIKNRNTKLFEEYLSEVFKIGQKYGFRISIHSGSDKYSIYPIISKVTKGNFHLKTAGTYYLEELKVIAKYDPDLFGEIYHFSLAQFQNDRDTYEISTGLINIPDVSNASNMEIVDLLDGSSGNESLRQMLHVTYGSVLTAETEEGSLRFADRCLAILQKEYDAYFDTLYSHIKKTFR